MEGEDEGAPTPSALGGNSDRETVPADENRSFGMGDMPYDAVMNGTYVLSFLDSDFARLYLFRNNIGNFPDRKWLVLCFHHQAKFLREYLGSGVRLKVIPMAEVMEKLKIKRREII